MFESLLKTKPARAEAKSLIVRERPQVSIDAAALVPEPRHGELLTEYAAITKSIGFSHPHVDADLRVEAFKAFLRSKDWGIFSLTEVVAYMDKKAAEESEAKAGWHWRPLRDMDHLPKVKFGKEGDATRNRNGESTVIPASDFYWGLHEHRTHWDNSIIETASAAAYDRLVPLHALRKVKTIEDDFGKGHVSFFVSDYAPAWQIEYPDPFLMAVVNNSRLNKGVGRFVIDFWDEPGFGLDKQLGL